jgi:hypothetical protein
VSLDGFNAGLAALVCDPDLVRRVRAGDHGWRPDSDVTDRELSRLITMANDPRMEVLCSLYRSNRLTALVRTVPAVVDALGDRLGGTVTEFWNRTPRTDMQFRSEGHAFCAFVRRRYPDNAVLQGVVDEAEAALRARFATDPSRDHARAPS